MLSFSETWMGRLLGMSPAYHAANMPGSFPEEDVNPAPRNAFNSASINATAVSASAWLSFLVVKPVVMVLLVLLRVLAKLINVLYFKDHYVAPGHSNTLSDPIDKVSRFVRDLEDSLSPSQQQQRLQNENAVLPPFFQGSYTQALYMAHQRAKFLFVYLTHPQNENSQNIFHQVVTNPDFLALFENENVLIWGGDLTNPEAYQLANSLNVTRFPFVGLLCLARSTTMSPQGPVKTSPKISLVLKIQGTAGTTQLDARTLITKKFVQKMAKFEPDLLVIREELREKFASQALLRQQDLNYQNSLARDRKKKEEAANKLQYKQYLAWKAAYFDKLLEDESGDRARVAIKLKNGTRSVFLFPADAPVRDLFTYVELVNRDCLNGKLSCDVGDAEAEQKFAGVRFKYDFKLLSPVPPRTVLNDLVDTGTKIRDVECIYPNGMLMVEDL